MKEGDSNRSTRESRYVLRAEFTTGKIEWTSLSAGIICMPDDWPTFQKLVDGSELRGDHRADLYSYVL